MNHDKRRRVNAPLNDCAKKKKKKKKKKTWEIWIAKVYRPETSKESCPPLKPVLLVFNNKNKHCYRVPNKH